MTLSDSSDIDVICDERGCLHEDGDASQWLYDSILRAACFVAEKDFTSTMAPRHSHHLPWQ